MAYVDEITGAEAYNWDEEGIYQLEENDPVQAGPGGVSNRQATELAKRTRNLHDRIIVLLGEVSEDFNSLAKIEAAIEALDFSDVNLDDLRNELRGGVANAYNDMKKIVDYIESLTYLPTYQGTSAQSANTIDWRGTPERTRVLAGNVEFDASNLIAGKTIGMKVTGAYEATFTSKFKKATGSRAHSTTRTNYYQMKCLNAASGAELIIYINTYYEE